VTGDTTGWSWDVDAAAGAGVGVGEAEALWPGVAVEAEDRLWAGELEVVDGSWPVQPPRTIRAEARTSADNHLRRTLVVPLIAAPTRSLCELLNRRGFDGLNRHDRLNRRGEGCFDTLKPYLGGLCDRSA
jgi:hypothetical protein